MKDLKCLAKELAFYHIGNRQLRKVLSGQGFCHGYPCVLQRFIGIYEKDKLERRVLNFLCFPICTIDIISSFPQREIIQTKDVLINMVVETYSSTFYHHCAPTYIELEHGDGH